MKIWKNTETLNAHIPSLAETASPAEAELAVLGSKAIELDRFPQLKGVFKCGVGMDNIPFEQCSARGIQVCTPSEDTRNIIYEETASYATYLVFRMLYDDVGSIESWTKARRKFVSEKSVLVLGMGNIGRRVARKLEPTVEVLTYDILDSKSLSLDDLLAVADVVTLHIPLNSDNRGFVDTRKLGLMKTGAAMVNTSRGAIVDEDALLEAIKAKRLRAAFDVFWEEPYMGKLKAFHPHRFYMSPHVASSCREFLEGLAKDFAEFQTKLESC